MEDPSDIPPRAPGIRKRLARRLSSLRGLATNRTRSAGSHPEHPPPSSPSSTYSDLVSEYEECIYRNTHPRSEAPGDVQKSEAQPPLTAREELAGSEPHEKHPAHKLGTETQA